MRKFFFNLAYFYLLVLANYSFSYPSDFEGKSVEKKVIFIVNKNIPIKPNLSSLVNNNIVTNGNAKFTVLLNEGDITINNSIKSDKYSISIINGYGKVVYSDLIVINDGYNQFLLNQRLIPGLYMVRIYSNENNIIKKCILCY